MDVFNLRENLIRDYSNYVKSFIRIADPAIREHVQKTNNNASRSLGPQQFWAEAFNWQNVRMLGEKLVEIGNSARCNVG